MHACSPDSCELESKSQRLSTNFSTSEPCSNSSGLRKYLAHKKKRFKSLDQNVAKSGAFTIEDADVRKEFEAEYSKTAPLYYRGQIPLDKILARIQQDLARL